MAISLQHVPPRCLYLLSYCLCATLHTFLLLTQRIHSFEYSWRRVIAFEGPGLPYLRSKDAVSLFTALGLLVSRLPHESILCARGRRPQPLEARRELCSSSVPGQLRTGPDRYQVRASASWAARCWCATHLSLSKARVSCSLSRLWLIHGPPSATVRYHPSWRSSSLQPLPVCARPATLADQPLGRSPPPSIYPPHALVASHPQLVPSRSTD